MVKTDPIISNDSKTPKDIPSFTSPDGCVIKTKADVIEEKLPKSGEFMLPNGCILYWKDNEVGGRTYFSDETGGGVTVWDTALVSHETLIAAIYVERCLLQHEGWR